MKKLLFLILSVFCFFGCSSTKLSGKTDYSWKAFTEKYKINPEYKGKKIILDSDLMYFNDDTFTLFELLKLRQYGYVDILGITTAGGNTISSAAAYDFLAILDHLSVKDIPVYVGNDVPLDGFKDIHEILSNTGNMDWTGTYALLDNYTKDYIEAAQRQVTHSNNFLEKPVSKPAAGNAADFIVQSINSNPGNVVIVAIGGLTNIAEALQKDPSIAKKAYGIVYMGGVFDAHGENLENVEINWWYDPKATQTCLTAGWNKQLVVPHDAALSALVKDDVWKRYKAKDNSAITHLINRDENGYFTKYPFLKLSWCWDPITVAVMACPDIIDKMDERNVAVESKMGFAYGSTLNWYPKYAPNNTGKCNVVLSIKRDMFWDFISDLYALDDAQR